LITYYHFNELDSTNNYAESLIKDKRPTAPFVITTDYQTKGQGTKQRIWFAEKNTSFLYSLMLYSEKPKINTEKMVLTAATTLQTLLEKEYKINCIIKPPNDLYINKKKIAGILIKNIIQGKQCWTIIGIGMNINTKKFPVEIAEKATSLYLETNKEVTIKKLYKKVTTKLMQSYQNIMEK
tara:strand:+ start:7218 stop:7760 length:543 start_codon:yes stop_codon:yes gene_type:complete